MTLLDTKANRDNYGIDTYERGVVYAALLLRASNTDTTNTRNKQQNPYYSAVRIASNSNSSLLTIRAKFPYNSNLALREGGNFIMNIKTYENKNPNPFLYQIPPTVVDEINVGYLHAVDDPYWVNTLEKYFAWTAHNLIYGFLSLTEGQQSGSIQFLEEDALEPSLQIDLTLPISYSRYLISNSLIYAVERIVTGELISITPVEDAFSNTSLIDNNFILSN